MENYVYRMVYETLNIKENTIVGQQYLGHGPEIVVTYFGKACFYNIFYFWIIYNLSKRIT